MRIKKIYRRRRRKGGRRRNCKVHAVDISKSTLCTKITFKTIINYFEMSMTQVREFAPVRTEYDVVRVFPSRILYERRVKYRRRNNDGWRKQQSRLSICVQHKGGDDENTQILYYNIMTTTSPSLDSVEFVWETRPRVKIRRVRDTRRRCRPRAIRQRSQGVSEKCTGCT